MRILVALLGLSCFLLWDARASEKIPPTTRPKTPATKSKSERVFRARCSACHGIDRVSHRRASRAEWREIVNRMRRMPQSGISPNDARVILDVLVSMSGQTQIEDAKKLSLGGHRVFGKKRWLAILETARVRKGKVKIGGIEYAAYPAGRTLTLERKGRKLDLSFRADGKPGKNAVIDSWRVGKVAYEVRLVLYEIRNGVVRVGRAIRRRP